MPTATITIKGISFECPQPYSAGHVCNEAEAKALNTMFAENIRNNFAKREERVLAEEKRDESALQERFAEYAASYVLGGSRGLSADPLQREAIRIAAIVVRAQLNREGKSEKDIGTAEFTKRVAALSRSDGVREEAQRRVSALAAVSQELLEGDL